MLNQVTWLLESPNISHIFIHLLNWVLHCGIMALWFQLSAQKTYLWSLYPVWWMFAFHLGPCARVPGVPQDKNCFSGDHAVFPGQNQFQISVRRSTWKVYDGSTVLLMLKPVRYCYDWIREKPRKPCPNRWSQSGPSTMLYSLMWTVKWVIYLSVVL